MALQMNPRKQQSHSISLFVIAIIACFALAGGLLYDALIQRGSLSISPNYSYTIDQSINNTVNYFDNSFYPNGPESDNSAYVTSLTDTVNSMFHYSYNASSEAKQLSYTYSVNALVRGTYGVPGGTEDVSSVWSKHFQLVAPITKTVKSSTFTVDRTITIPFDKYRKSVEDFRLGLALPVSSELQLQYTIKVDGVTKAGEKFSDSRSSTISAPLNVQIYQLANKYDKTDTKEVSPQTSGGNSNWQAQAEIIGAIILAATGLALIGFSLSKNKYKSDYQRQLQKIFRYHDGIIIRTSKAVKVSRTKTIIPVKSFDDILNLEEETKSPIIASPAGDTATRFMIADGDIVYLFVLGVESGETLIEDDLDTIEASMEQKETVATPHRKHPVRRTSNK